MSVSLNSSILVAADSLNQPGQENCNNEKLPPEILKIIFSNLNSFSDLHSAAYTCKYWHIQIKDSVEQFANQLQMLAPDEVKKAISEWKARDQAVFVPSIKTYFTDLANSVIHLTMKYTFLQLELKILILSNSVFKGEFVRLLIKHQLHLHPVPSSPLYHPVTYMVGGAPPPPDPFKEMQDMKSLTDSLNTSFLKTQIPSTFFDGLSKKQLFYPRQKEEDEFKFIPDFTVGQLDLVKIHIDMGLFQDHLAAANREIETKKSWCVIS